MCKNSITNLLVIFISWNIIYANCIFSLYAFPSTHSEDDDECDGDLTANGWIFNTPSHFALVNSSFTSILFNNFASSSCLCLCSLLYASFPLLFVTISQSHFLHSCFCDLQNFKNAHNFRQETKTIFYGYTIFFILELFAHYIHFSPAYHLLINIWSSKLIQPITTIFHVPCTTIGSISCHHYEWTP